MISSNDEKKDRNKFNPLSLVLILSGLFFLLFIGISGFIYFNHSYKNFKSGAVGLLEVKGIIIDSKSALEKLEEFEEDDRVRAVVIKLNSPGGSVAPSQEIYEAVKNYSKPVVISMNSVAASGAFYIAMGSKKIFANPGSLTGSIGVIMNFANFGKLYDWAKVHRYVIKSGKYKDTGADYREMSSDEKQLFQDMVNDILEQFKIAIVESRQLSMEKVTEIADGRVFSGQQAKKLGLIDELGTLNNAILEAAKLGGIQGKPQVVEAKRRKKSLMNLMIEDSLYDDAEGKTFASFFQQTLGKIFFSQLNFESPFQSQNNISSGIYLLWGQK